MSAGDGSAIMELDSKTSNNLVSRITKAVRPLKIILFGSAARAELRPDSDIDVLVVMPNGVHRRRTAQDIYSNLIGFDYSVDVVVATESDLDKYGNNFSLVYYPALREGKVIYAA